MASSALWVWLCTCVRRLLAIALHQRQQQASWSAPAGIITIIIITIKTFLSQEASGTCDASQLPPDKDMPPTCLLTQSPWGACKHCSNWAECRRTCSHRTCSSSNMCRRQLQKCMRPWHCLFSSQQRITQAALLLPTLSLQKLLGCESSHAPSHSGLA